MSFTPSLAMRKARLKSVLWSVSAEDWRFESDQEALLSVERMLPEVRSRDILLFHDEKTYSAIALEALIPALRERGLGVDVDLETML